MLESQDSTNMCLSKVLETLWVKKDREVWSTAFHGIAKSWTWLSNWKNINSVLHMLIRRQYSNLKYRILYISETKTKEKIIIINNNKTRCFLKYGYLSTSFMNIWMILLLKLWEFEYFMKHNLIKQFTCNKEYCTFQIWKFGYTCPYVKHFTCDNGQMIEFSVSCIKVWHQVVLQLSSSQFHIWKSRWRF